MIKITLTHKNLIKHEELIINAVGVPSVLFSGDSFYNVVTVKDESGTLVYQGSFPLSKSIDVLVEVVK